MCLATTLIAAEGVVAMADGRLGALSRTPGMAVEASDRLCGVSVAVLSPSHRSARARQTYLGSFRSSGASFDVRSPTQSSSATPVRDAASLVVPTLYPRTGLDRHVSVCADVVSSGVVGAIGFLLGHSFVHTPSHLHLFDARTVEPHRSFALDYHSGVNHHAS